MIPLFVQAGVWGGSSSRKQYPPKMNLMYVVKHSNNCVRRRGAIEKRNSETCTSPVYCSTAVSIPPTDTHCAFLALGIRAQLQLFTLASSLSEGLHLCLRAGKNSPFSSHILRRRLAFLQLLFRAHLHVSAWVLIHVTVNRT